MILTCSTRYYDHNKPMGSRFSASVANSTVDRMYHSAATLLPDGSIFSSGSNPNADFIAPGTPGYRFPTEYRVERFYPDYYTLPRPVPSGVPTTLTYGGAYFNISLPASSVGAISNLDNTKVTIIRPGFSTHAMNMGQRFVQLSVSSHELALDFADFFVRCRANSFTVYDDGSAILHVSQLPPNPAILVPGPALIFVVVNGVPSNGTWVMVGNGVLGRQPIAAAQVLPVNRGGSGGVQNLGNAVVTRTAISQSTPTGKAGTVTTTGANGQPVVTSRPASAASRVVVGGRVFATMMLIGAGLLL